MLVNWSRLALSTLLFIGLGASASVTRRPASVSDDEASPNFMDVASPEEIREAFGLDAWPKVEEDQPEATEEQVALDGMLIDVDLSRQRMTVRSASFKQQWPVSTGMEGYETHEGRFNVFLMKPMHISKSYPKRRPPKPSGGARMPFTMFFTKDGQAVHGSDDRESLGRRTSSHGCVHLAEEHAAALFRAAKPYFDVNPRLVQVAIHY